MKNLILSLTKKGTYTLVLLFLCSLYGCKFYYETQTVKTVTTQEIKKSDSENKYFIFHRGSTFWHLSGIVVNDGSLEGNLSAVPAERSDYEITDSKRSYRYITDDRNYVLDQVHLYLKNSATPAIDSVGHVKVALTDIKKIEVYQKDKGRTLASWLIPGIGTSVVILVIIAKELWGW